jgi:4-hydroxy-tetrahydrodipicolinate synthase
VIASSKRFGLSAALTTPFRPGTGIDFPRLVAHARWCLDSGCSSVTAFGTTGEGASIGPAAREQVLGAFAAAEIDSDRVVGGVSAASMHSAVAQARTALDFGCRALLLPPPFYFKGVSDDGLFAWFAYVFEALGVAARDVLLYNIPSVTQLALSIDLVSRLRTAFPEVVTGVKDSSGDWAYTCELLDAHGDLAILIGDERYLAEGIRRGGQGAISGLANVCPEVLRPMVEEGRDDARVGRLVEAVLQYPVTPAVKALVAYRTGDRTWLNVRPPLVPMSDPDASTLQNSYEALFAARAA